MTPRNQLIGSFPHVLIPFSALFLALGLGGCSSRTESASQEPEPGEVPGQTEEDDFEDMGGIDIEGGVISKGFGNEPPACEDYHEVGIFYATDRNKTGKDNPAVYFGKDPNRQLLDSPLQYGKALVSIPCNHTLGVVEGRKLWELHKAPNPQKHVMITNLKEFKETDFFKQLDQDAAVAPETQALLFIHGFNVNFNDAVRRTAQIAFDLQFPGVAMAYSWPADGYLVPNQVAYQGDFKDAQWSAPHLADLLMKLQNDTEIEKVHIIAHSMGTELLSRALIEAKGDGFNLKLNNIVLAAPDISADTFVNDIMPRIQPTTDRLTLYTSSGDKALLASARLNNTPRLGLSQMAMVVAQKIETIDCSEIDTSLIGHGYYGSHKKVVEDLHYLLSGQGPEERGLKRNNNGVWLFP